MTVKKRNSWPAKLSCATLAVVILLSGCATVSKSTNHYLMSPVAPATTLPPLNFAVGVGPVTLADHLQRQNIIVRKSPTRVHIAPDDRWAAPLPAHLSALLATNLRQRLGLPNIPTFPWPQVTRVDYQVTVHITRFIYYGDRVYLDAHWRLLNGPSTVVAEHPAVIEEVCGADYDSIVDAMSRAVGRLSDKISDTIRQGRSG